MARRPSKSGSPLDARQQKLLEEQEKLRRREEQLKRMIEEAPRIKEARVKQQRESLLADRTIRGHRFNSSTLVDSRFGQFGAPAPSRSRRKPLKAERRQTQLMFLGLLLVLGLLVVWLLSVWHWQWPAS